MTKVYAVLWQYYDNSAYGIFEVCQTKAEAEDLVARLSDHDENRQYVIRETVMREAAH